MSIAGSLPRKWSMRMICHSSSISRRLGVELAGRREVVPERLLHHHPGPLGEPGPRQTGDHAAEQRRWDLQVEHRRPAALDRQRRRGRRWRRRCSRRSPSTGARRSGGTRPRRCARHRPRSRRGRARAAGRRTTGRSTRRRSGSRAACAAPGGTRSGTSSSWRGRRRCRTRRARRRCRSLVQPSRPLVRSGRIVARRRPRAVVLLGDPPSEQRVVLVGEEPRLGVEAAGEAGELAVGADHAVARDDDAQRVAAVRRADGPGLARTSPRRRACSP